MYIIYTHILYMYIHMYVYIYNIIYIHMYVCTRIYTYIYISRFIYVYMYIYVCIYIYIHTYIHTYIHKCAVHVTVLTHFFMGISVRHGAEAAFWWPALLPMASQGPCAWRGTRWAPVI